MPAKGYHDEAMTLEAMPEWPRAGRLNRQPKRRVRPVAAGTGAAFLLIALAGAAALGFGAEPEAEPGRIAASPQPEALLGTDEFQGTLEGGTATPFVGSTGSGDNHHALNAPTGTSRIIAAMDWTPRNGGAEELQLVVSSNGRELARQTGRPGFSLELIAPLGGSALDYHVIPAPPIFARGEVVIEQRFSVSTQFWSEGP